MTSRVRTCHCCLPSVLSTIAYVDIVPTGCGCVALPRVPSSKNLWENTGFPKPGQLWETLLPMFLVFENSFHNKDRTVLPIE